MLGGAYYSSKSGSGGCGKGLGVLVTKHKVLMLSLKQKGNRDITASEVILHDEFDSIN